MPKYKMLSLVAVVFLAVYGSPAAGQVVPPSMLVINVGNQVEYVQDTSDVLSFATDSLRALPAHFSKNFNVVINLGDIVSVNGQPAKGTYVGRTHVIQLRPDPAAGQAIADVTRTSIRDVIFDIMKPDGTPIGNIVGLGLSGGSPPPGAPGAQTGGNWAIVGGTGAFLGARGEFGGAQPRGSPIGRTASMTEDPAKRRVNGGETQPIVLTVVPMHAPEIVTLFGGPAIVHSRDSSLVTDLTPAAAGEVLSLRATGLGPTVPGVDPGQPFPATPPSFVNSPIEVKVNERNADVLAAVGIPGLVDAYEVKFRVPADITKGPAKIKVSAAWIVGPSMTIDIQ